MTRNKKYIKPSIFDGFGRAMRLGQVELVYLDILFNRDKMVGIFEYHGDVRILGKPQKEAYMERVNKIKN